MTSNIAVHSALAAALVLGGLLSAAAAYGEDQAGAPQTRPTLHSTPPDDFSNFVFIGHPDESRVLSNYLWYHFSHRLHLQKALFYHEYLTTADMWLAGAALEPKGRSVQEVFRENLLSMQLDDEGYVHTHQHYSHAHETGWPFPLWAQAGTNAEETLGVAVGWHFQLEDHPHAWIWQFLEGWELGDFHGEAATRNWELVNCESHGIVDNRWRIQATGPNPTLTTPADVEIDAFNAPFLQLRWKRTPAPAGHALPYIEWLCDGDAEFGPDRRVYLHSRDGDHSTVTDTTHTMIRMYRHPKWTGQIKRMRLCLAPDMDDVQLEIDSLFTVYDTRHAINNPIFIFSSWNYFRWTQDIGFLAANINRMRIALRYLQTEMGGLEHGHILNSWPGHDGIPGWVKGKDGSLTMQPGHGIGNNYYDLLPFGWKDCYATMQYCAALRVMADVEEAILNNPGWDIPRGALALDPEKLRKHAADVKETGNRLFWNNETGRYFGCISKEGNSYDFGFTWLGLEAIWYGFATDEHARAIMDWISGRRIVAEDTSVGADIYRWRFGPRATTRRNVEWYGQCWIFPESIPFGGQIQDGGAVVGFAFYDLYARLKVLGPDDAWQRLAEIIDWEREVWEHGGYRAYYADGRQGTTLQGGGTAGGIGIDFEFFESSLLPSAVVYGFLGLNPGADALRIAPRLPSACPEMGVRNLLYRGTTMDVWAGPKTITVDLKTKPGDGIVLELNGRWTLEQTGAQGSRFTLTDTGKHEFREAE